MFAKLFNHIKKHKLWYTLGTVAALVLLGIYSFFFHIPNFDDLDGELAGSLGRAKKPRLPRIEITSPLPGITMTPESFLVIMWDSPLADRVEPSLLKHTVYLFPKNGRAKKIGRFISGMQHVWKVPKDLEGEFRIAVGGTLGKGIMSGFFTVEDPNQLPSGPKCTEQDWKCDAFEPQVCPKSGIRHRICLLINQTCIDPEEVRPDRQEQCTYTPPVTTANTAPTNTTAPPPVANPQPTETITKQNDGVLYFQDITRPFPISSEGYHNLLSFKITAKKQSIDITRLDFFSHIQGMTVLEYSLTGEYNKPIVTGQSKPEFRLNTPITIPSGSSKTFNLRANIRDISDSFSVNAKLFSTGVVSDASAVNGLPLERALQYPDGPSATTTTTAAETEESGAVLRINNLNASSDILADGYVNLLSFNVTADSKAVNITKLDFNVDYENVTMDAYGLTSIYNKPILVGLGQPTFTLNQNPIHIPLGATKKINLRANVRDLQADTSINAKLIPTGIITDAEDVEGLPMENNLTYTVE